MSAILELPTSPTAEALDRTSAIYRAAGERLAERGLLAGVADEGGYWPAFTSNEEAIEELLRAIERARLVPGRDAAISLDVAASQFGSGGRYHLGRDGRSSRTSPARNPRLRLPGCRRSLTRRCRTQDRFLTARNA